jgi:FkbM family methyltransferase
VVNVFVGTIKLKMRLSQKTPLYYAQNPMYDRALPRICEYLQKIDQQLVIIDVGANVGDTAALISAKVNGASILCVEGNEEFIDFLKYNVLSIKRNDIYIVPEFCVDTLVDNQFNVETKNGTAHLSKSDNEINNINTLDNMISFNPIFNETNLLKIDTDGFEILVINGAKKLLKQKHPIIFFEFTPGAYIENGQDPMDLVTILVSHGYRDALFYDNFGNPIGIYKLNDRTMIQKLIDSIDNKKIYYYDILCIHANDEKKYLQILDKELKIV